MSPEVNHSSSLRWSPLVAAWFLSSCGGPPRFAEHGAFSASGSCGAALGHDEPAYGGDGDSRFAGRQVLVTFEDGHVVHVDIEEESSVLGGSGKAEHPVDELDIWAGRWQRIDVPVRWQSERYPEEITGGGVLQHYGPISTVRVEVLVQGEHAKLRLDGGAPVDAECAWD